MKLFKTFTAQTKTGGPFFVFMDESGKKESDRYFVCGFLEIQDNHQFVLALRRVADQIKNLSIRNRIARVDLLKADANIEELYKLARSFSEFELKHYRISGENQNLYCDLIKALFKKIKFRFTAIVIDRKDPAYIRSEDSQQPLYLKVLKLYAVHCARDSEYVFVPDDFDSGFEWNVKSGRLPIAILPLDSKSCLQLQVADILSGLIAQGLKINSSEALNNQDKDRQSVLETLEQQIGRKIYGNLTIHEPAYFSVWIIDFGKTKRPGHGQETQPQP